MPNAAPQPVYPAPTDYAIVVGINGYNDGIPPLQGCVNDAELFREWLIDKRGGGLNPENVELIKALTPGKPIREDIEDLLFAFIRHQNQTGRPRGRRLYLYFAGHGITPRPPNDDDCGLVMANAFVDVLRALPGRLVARRLRNRALFGEIVLFMDCCRQVSGVASASSELPDHGDVAIAASLPFIHGFAAQWGLTVAERLLPHPLDPTKPASWQGVFTHVLLRGLMCAVDANGEITSISLKDFVRTAVQEHLPETDNRRPQIDYSEDLKPISFGLGVRVQLEVRSPGPITEVTILDGDGLKEIARSQQPTTTGTHSFQLAPARYVAVGKDVNGNVVTKKAAQVFGETAHVDL